MRININGRNVQMLEKSLTHDLVFQHFFGRTPTDGEVLTVTWSSGNRCGGLAPGISIPVEDGMHVSAHFTGRS
jgi:hypothetical protein